MYRIKGLAQVSLGCLFVVLFSLGRVSAEISLDYQKGGVYLNWTEPALRINGERLDPSEIAGYNIYRSLVNNDQDYKRVNDELIRRRDYLDQTIKWGNIYYYALTTIDNRGLESPRSSIKEAIPPLSPPREVNAFGQKQRVLLTWGKTNNSQIRGYNIYRSRSPGQGYKKIASVLDSEVEYIDQQVISGKNYYYVLSTVDISWQESSYCHEVGATPLLITQEEILELEKINGFRAMVENKVVVLRWEALGIDSLAGYNVYRRGADSQETNNSKKVNKNLIPETTFIDDQVQPQKSYYYSIAAVDKNNNEAQFPREIYVTVADLYINSLSDNSGGTPLKGGKILSITLIGTPGKIASATLSGVVEDVPLKETDHEGVYYGECLIPEGINHTDITFIGKLRDGENVKVEFTSPNTITIDNTPPTAAFLIQEELTQEKVCVTWELDKDALAEIAYLEIYRSSIGCVQDDKGELISSQILPQETFFCDRQIRPKQRYFYHLMSYDKAGNYSMSEECLEVVTLADSIAPEIYTVKELNQPGTKRAGDVILIEMSGETKAEGRFSLGEKINQSFKEVGSGRYLMEYAVKEGDDVDLGSAFIELIDPSGNCTIWGGNLAISINTKENAIKPPAITLVEHNNLFSPMVAGDVLEFEVRGEPGCTAFVNLGAMVNHSFQQSTLELTWDQELVEAKFGHAIDAYHVYHQNNLFSNIQNLIPIERLPVEITSYSFQDHKGGYLAITAKKRSGEEQIILTPRGPITLTEIEPGLYKGKYEIKPGDYLFDKSVTAYLVNNHGDISEPVTSTRPITVDTSVEIFVNIPPEGSFVKADNTSRTDVNFKVKNAKGEGVADREIAVDLFTTFDEYSGIVGIGHFEQDEFGYIDNLTKLITDFQGEVKVPYVAGYAAKTIIIRARDIMTNNVGIGYITSYVEDEITINLLESLSRQRFRQNGFSLEVWADSEWLTADGVSKTYVHARVLNSNGQPVSGHVINFILAAGDGKLTNLPTSNITDQSGEVKALYVAGRKIGSPRIIVTDNTVEGVLSQELTLTLKSDAPAKISISLDTLDDSHNPIYADGMNTLDLVVQVLDINDNPNRELPLQIEIIRGGGDLIFSGVPKTDRDGKYRLKYRVSDTPGLVTIRSKAVSRIPDSEMIDKIRILGSECF